MNVLPGKKTFLVAGIMFVYALAALFLDKIDSSEAIRMILEAGGLVGLRLGMK